jgi:glycogen(starch) synthase
MSEQFPNVVLRLARTIPRPNQPGVGLHCFYYSKQSRRQSLIIAKRADDDPYLPREDTKIVEVTYGDYSANKEYITLLDTLRIGITKIYGELYIFFAAIFALRRYKMRPEVIHVHSVNYILAGVLLKFIYHAPLCLNFGGTELLRAEKLRYYRFLFKFLSIGFYVARDMERRLFKFMPMNSVCYTGNGVDHSLFYPAKNITKKKEIICVGNLRWQKDYVTLIEAFSQIANDFPDWIIRIFGEGPLRNELFAEIHSKSLGERIFLEGMKSQQLICSAMQAAQIYLICSKSEGFPKSLIEAMACGMPVIATDAGECAYVLSGIIQVVPKSNPSALANALSVMIQDDNLRKNVSIACYERSFDYSWNSVSSIIDDTYDRLICEFKRQV